MTKTDNTENRTTGKKRYTPPQLNEFGALHRITRGTGGTMGDGGIPTMGMGGMM
ncbi:MAG: hypothetical protein ROR55_09250 [Devosia sp.]